MTLHQRIHLLSLIAAAMAAPSLLAQTDPQIPVLSHHIPALVSGGHATRLQPLDPTHTLTLDLVLPSRNQAALEAEVAGLYTPSSPSFHHFLTSAAFDSKYGPTQQDYDTLLRWAHGKGLAVTQTTSNRRLVSVSGPADVVNRAFHLVETEYQDTLHNRTFHAPDREPTTDLAIPLYAVAGLDDATPIHSQLRRGTRNQQLRATHDITGSGPSNTYLPSDIRAAYYGSGPLDGTGQTVAVFSYDGYLTSDLAVYASNTGTTNIAARVQNVLVGSYSGNCYSASNGTSGTCDDGEQILDLEQVAGMAPGLTQILFYESTSAVAELNQMASDNLASVITSSWGGGNFGHGTDPTYLQMAAQGQTFLNATGDDGALNSSNYAAPAVDPYVLEVGGTDLLTQGAGGPWLSEDAWTFSSGGFYNDYAPIPAWQQTPGVITAANGGSTTYRNVPDLAAEANFDNPTVSNGAFATGYGGTSFAAPRLAGYLALANQQSANSGYGRLGFINPTLYTLGLATTAANVYHDITFGANPSDVGTIVTFNAVPGYDLVTGWGSPNGPGLINALVQSLTSDFSLSTSAASLTLARSSSVTTTIGVIDQQSFSGAVTFSASGMPAGVTASFSPATSASSTTLTLTADNTTQLATSTITITGVSGSLQHTVPLNLNLIKRTAGDFTTTVSTPALAIVPGGPLATNTVTITPGAGNPNIISIAVSGLPTGVTATLSAGSVSVYSTSNNSTLTLTAAAGTVAGTYPITINGNDGTLTHATSFNLIVTPTQLLGNPGFENGQDTAPWIATGEVCTSACGVAPNSGNYYLFMDGDSAAHTDLTYQTVTVPNGYTTLTLAFALRILTSEKASKGPVDTLTVQLLDSSGNVLSTPYTFSNLNSGTIFSGYSTALGPYSGQTVTLKFTGVQAGRINTDFLLDDVTLTVQ